MNATKNGAKDQEEQEVQVLVILMPWDISSAGKEVPDDSLIV